MDLKELGSAMSEVLALRGVIDSLDEKIDIIEAQLSANRQEIARLENLQKSTDKAGENREKLVKERSSRNADLVKRLAKLDEVGVKLPIKERFSAGRVSL